MNELAPMLQTKDIMRTRNWYEEVLGFRCVSAQHPTHCCKALLNCVVNVSFGRWADWKARCSTQGEQEN